MKNDFSAGAESKGIDCEFTFSAYTYHLQTFNDRNGSLSRISLDSEQLPLPLRAYLDDVCTAMNNELAQGETVHGIITKYSAKGEAGPGRNVTASSPTTASSSSARSISA